MGNTELQEKVFAIKSFQKQYERLLFESAVQAIQNLDAIEIGPSYEIDWNNLLSFASILSTSTDFNGMDAALRISQHCLSLISCTEPQKVAAAVILEKLTNKPAIKLAIERGFLLQDYKKQIPLPLRMEYLKRELSNSIINSRDKLIFLNRFQTEVYEKHLEADILSISAPTSSGKSFILYTIVLEKLLLEEQIHIVYLVPTRALITQVEQDLRKLTQEEKLNVYISSVPQTPELTEYKKSKVFIFTQERLHWFRTESPLTKFDLIIIDEAQNIENSTRGILLQQKIEEIVKDFPTIKLLFSSPFTSNPEILINDFSSKKIKTPINTEFVAVNQNLFFLKRNKTSLTKWSIDLQIKNNQLSIGHVNLPLSPNTELKKIAYLTFAVGDKSGGNIIYANIPSDAEKTAILIFELLDTQKELKDKHLDELIKLTKQIVHVQYKLATVLEKGIAFHYGNMPPIIRQEIERLFKLGKIKYLICTSTLLEGVNLPAKSIFIRSPKKGKKTPMSQSDFWNLAGRAGRWGKEFQGNIFCIEPQKWENEPSIDRKKQTLFKATDLFKKLEKQVELSEYIKSKTPRETAKKNPDLEGAFGYFYIKYLQNELVKQDEDNVFFSKLKQDFDEISKLTEIPKEIVYRNPGISIFAQQNLLEYFKNNEKIIHNLIPLAPEDKDAVKKSYQPIIKIINEHLSGDITHDNYCMYLAILIVNWMRGYTLSRIIGSNWDYWRKKDKARKLDNVIRESMQDVEEIARFKFAKYSSCYIDILRFYLKSIGASELEKQIPRLNIWLEFGVSQKTQISLIGLGLSRSTAIIASESIASSTLDRNEAKKWLENNYENLSISLLMKEEIERILFG